MSTLRLSESDRAKWNVAEVVEFDLKTIGLRSVSALKKQTGYTIGEAAALGFDGKIVIQPDGSEKVERDDDALAAVVWVVLYAAGYRSIPWADFDPSPRGLKLEFDEGGEDEGKAPETDGSNTTTDS